MAADADKRIHELYAAPLAEFVERRDRLSRELRKDGSRREAEAVKGLRKPTVPAWTVNQLARREKMGLRSLLTAGERLRKAHEALLAGGPPDPVQKARDDERRAIAELERAAGSLLADAGHPATEATLERVRETLHAAAVDEEVERRVREGRLEREESAAGFGFGTAAAPTSRPPARAARTRSTAREAPAGRAREDARAKREQEQRARREQAARERRREAEEALAAARRALREAERAVGARRRELERAEGELRRRQEDLRSAERTVEQARKSSGR